MHLQNFLIRLNTMKVEVDKHACLYDCSVSIILLQFLQNFKIYDYGLSIKRMK